MRSASAAAILTFVLPLAACAGAPEAGREGDAVQRIEAAIDAFEEALEDRDLRRVCDRIFSPEGRRRAGGEECPRRLRQRTADLRDPDIELLSVSLERTGATARVRASSDGEESAVDTIRLVPSEGRYAIESLSGG